MCFLCQQTMIEAIHLCILYSTECVVPVIWALMTWRTFTCHGSDAVAMLPVIWALIITWRTFTHDGVWCCRCVPAISEPTCTWSGQLPMKIHRNPAYSCKVFLGGVPWDITEGENFIPLRQRSEFHESLCVTVQFNSQLAKGRWCCVTGKVTVGLALHWPCNTIQYNTRWSHM